MKLTVDQVLKKANVQLETFGVVMPAKSRAGQYVDVRTFQYYRSQQLLDPPDEKRGVSGLYGEKHVWQLLAIKTLQARWVPLSEIRKMLADAGVAELRTLVTQDGPNRNLPARSQPAKRSTNRQRKWIELRVSNEIYAMVDERVLSRSTPSTLRALGEKITAMLLSASG